MPFPMLTRALAAAALAVAATAAAVPADAGRAARARLTPVRSVRGPRFLEGETFVARTREEWEAAWRRSESPGRVPRVDFARRMVVGVRSGGMDGCAGFELLALRRSREAVEVLWRPTFLRGAYCTAAVWDGWQFGTVPRDEHDVTFRELPLRVYRARR